MVAATANPAGRIPSRYISDNSIIARCQLPACIPSDNESRRKSVLVHQTVSSELPKSRAVTTGGPRDSFTRSGETHKVAELTPQTVNVARYALA